MCNVITPRPYNEVQAESYTKYADLGRISKFKFLLILHFSAKQMENALFNVSRCSWTRFHELLHRL